MANCGVCGKKLGGITGVLRPHKELLQEAKDFNLSFPDEVCENCVYKKVVQARQEKKKTNTELGLEKIRQIFTTPAALPPDYIDLGLVTGYCIMGTGPLSAIASSWTDFLGEESNSYLEKINKAEDYAIRRAKQKTFDKGATAIFNLHINLTEASTGHGMLMISVWGSAARKKDEYLEEMIESEDLQEQFKQWLIKEGYKEYTPSDNPSTVYDYIKRINKVCKIEDCSWETLAKNINSIVPLYDSSGEKADIGKESHRAVISALKLFQKFVGDMQK